MPFSFWQNRPDPRPKPDQHSNQQAPDQSVQPWYVCCTDSMQPLPALGIWILHHSKGGLKKIKGRTETNRWDVTQPTWLHSLFFSRVLCMSMWSDMILNWELYRWESICVPLFPDRKEPHFAEAFRAVLIHAEAYWFPWQSLSCSEGKVKLDCHPGQSLVANLAVAYHLKFVFKMNSLTL
jgi:hypothetical protein